MATTKPKRAARAGKIFPAQRIIRGALTSLTRAELVRPLDDSEPAFIFKHTLVQETTNATLLKNQSKRLHRLVAYALEEVNASRLDEYAAELAEHFAEAEEDAKTLEYSMRAGDNAARVFANAEALAQYARAIEIAKRGSATTADLIHLYSRRGRTLEVISEYDSALASYQELHALAQARGDRPLELASLTLRATLHSAPLSTYNSELAMQLLLDALGTARELNDRAAEAQILWSLTLLNVHETHPELAIMYGEQSLIIAQELEAQGQDMRERIAFARHELVVPYYVTGQTARANKFSADAQLAWRALDNKPMLADSLGTAAQFAHLRGAYDEAHAYAAEGAEISSTIGNWFGWLFNQTMSAISYIEQGDWAQGLALADQIWERGQTINRANSFVIGAAKAYLLAQLGAFDAAENMERLTRAAMHHRMPEHFRARARGLFARILLVRGRVREASAELATIADQENLATMSQAAPDLAFAQVELTLAQGEFGRALQIADDTHAVFQHLGFEGLAVEILYLRGRALYGLGNLDAACETFQHAGVLGERLGARRTLANLFLAMFELEKARGNEEQATTYREQARAVIDFIMTHTPPDYRAVFLNLPRVRGVMM